jgi:hypothetical protein
MADYETIITGSLAVLPTVFHLILGLLREMSPISMDKQNSAVVTVCINCIRTLLNSKRYEGDKKLPDWHKLIQSSLATVIKNSISGMYMLGFLLPDLLTYCNTSNMHHAR